MSIRSEKNLYPGINPHLNSFLQQKGGGWQSFHKDYITYLREALDVLLPEVTMPRQKSRCKSVRMIPTRRFP
jgi:hypothetical protein